MSIYKVENKPVGAGKATSFEARAKEMLAMKVGQSFAFPVKDVHRVRGDMGRLHAMEKKKPEAQRMKWVTEMDGDRYRCGRVA